MKKTLVAVILAMLALSGCGNSSSSHTPTINVTDTLFVANVIGHNPALNSVSSDLLVKEAHKVCDYLSYTGLSSSAILVGAQQEHDKRPDLFPSIRQAAWFMGASVGAYCPELPP